MNSMKINWPVRWIAKLFVLISLSSLWHSQPALGQDGQPVIVSESKTLDIYVDGELLAKDGWTLNPDIHPDVFLIRSRLPYKSKKIAFSSPTDSVSFDVKAGNNYDFTVMLNGETPCEIRIAALTDPQFWDSKILIAVSVITLLVLAAIPIFWQRINPNHLLPLGIAAPLMFWLTTIFVGFKIPEYDHFRSVISELGTTGSATEVLTSCCFVAISLTCILFSVGFYKACRLRNVSTTPAWLSLAMPIGIFWAALFPLGNDLHGLLGPLPLLVNAAALFAFVLWRNKEGFRNISRLSLWSFYLMMLLFLIFVPSFNNAYGGLVQRFWYAGWSLWFLSLATSFPLNIEPHAKAGME